MREMPPPGGWALVSRSYRYRGQKVILDVLSRQTQAYNFRARTSIKGNEIQARHEDLSECVELLESKIDDVLDGKRPQDKRAQELKDFAQSRSPYHLDDLAMTMILSAAILLILGYLVHY